MPESCYALVILPEPRETQRNVWNECANALFLCAPFFISLFFPPLCILFLSPPSLHPSLSFHFGHTHFISLPPRFSFPLQIFKNIPLFLIVGKKQPPHLHSWVCVTTNCPSSSLLPLFLDTQHQLSFIPALTLTHPLYWPLQQRQQDPPTTSPSITLTSLLPSRLFSPKPSHLVQIEPSSFFLFFPSPLLFSCPLAKLLRC